MAVFPGEQLFQIRNLIVVFHCAVMITLLRKVYRFIVGYTLLK